MARNATGIEITEVCANICVMYTAVDVIGYGFSVFADAECVAASDDDAHNTGLDQMEEVPGVEVKQ